MNLWLIIVVIHTTCMYAVVKLKPEKDLGFNGIRTHDLCGTSAVLYQLSYQAVCEMVILWVCNIYVPIDDGYIREWMKVIFWCFFLHCKWFVFFSAFQAETRCPQNISAATRIWFSSVQTCSGSSSDIDVDWFRNAESSYLRWISVCISLSVEPWAKIWETTFARLDFFC